ncbi:hypothetical protein ABT116_42810, partial [Streptomyces sp. NPDC002130]
MSRTARPRCRAALAALTCCVAVGCGTGTAPQGGRPSPPPSAPRAAGPSVVTWASSAGHVGEAADGRGYRLMVVRCERWSEAMNQLVHIDGHVG